MLLGAIGGQFTVAVPAIDMAVRDLAMHFVEVPVTIEYPQTDGIAYTKMRAITDWWKIFRPTAWNAFGTADLEGADYRACANFGPIYG